MHSADSQSCYTSPVSAEVPLSPSSDTVTNPWANALGSCTHLTAPHIKTQAAVLRNLAQVFQDLRLRGFTTLLDEEHKLTIHAHCLSRSLLTTIQRLISQDFIGFQFDPADVPAYQEVLGNQRALFVKNQKDTLRRMLPRHLRPLFSRLYSLFGKGETIIAPLIDERGAFGAITVIAEWITPEDTEHIQALAGLISAALSRIEQLENLSSCERREHLRNCVLETLAQEPDISRSLPVILELTTAALLGDCGAIALLNEHHTAYSLAYHHNFPAHLIRSNLRLGEDPLSKTITSQQPLILNLLRSDRKAPAEWIESGIKAFLAVPLTAGDETLGSMLFCKSRETAPFTQVDLELAQSIASISAITIMNGLLYERARRNAQEAQALIHTANSISSSLDQETVLQKIAQQAKLLLNGDGSRVHIFNTERTNLRCVLALGPYADELMAFPIEAGTGMTGRVAEEGNAILINDLRQHPERVQIDGIPFDREEFLAIAPMSIRQQIIGTMTVTRRGNRQQFSPQNLELLKAFAAHAAIALENATLYSEIEAQAQRLESEVHARTHQLAISENRYRALVETSLVGVYQLDADAQFTYINKVICDLTGRSEEDILNRPLPDTNILTPASMQHSLQRFRERLEGKRPPQDLYEIELLAADGRVIPSLMAVSLIIDEQGVPDGVTGLLLDISDRKSLEAELWAERDRLNALLNNIGDAVLVTDPDGVIEYVNPAWEKQNLFDSAQVLGKTPSILNSGHQPPEFYREMWDTILAGNTWKGEVINRRQNGDLYDAALTITPVHNDEGDLVSLVGVQHDISALKAVDRLKTEFVSDVSHELRTPLTNIRLYLELLAKTEEAERRALYLDTLYRESGRLATLIEDLLTLSRMDAQQTPFRPLEFDLNQMLRELVSDRQPLASNKELTLTFTADNHAEQAYGDPNLLIQVFSNLLTNAMNYTPNGGTIELRTRFTAQAGGWLRIEVSDSGLGIPIEEQDRVFQRFYRGSASRKTGAAGTGLGLAICEDIIKKHNGRLEVHSPGFEQGTTFSVWLPLS